MRGLNRKEEIRGSKGGIQGGTAHIMGYLRSPLETYSIRSFLTYLHIQKKLKWHHQITGETKPQLHISLQTMKPLVLWMGYI